MAHDEIMIDIRSDPRLLAPVRATVRAYLSGLGFSHDRAGEAVLGIDEACTNAIRHSYGGSADGRIQIAFRCSESDVEIVLSDQGVPVSSDRCMKPSAPSPDAILDRGGGGLGVHLMHNVFDEVSYAPGDGAGNVVTMRLRRPETDGK